MLPAASEGPAAARRTRGSARTLTIAMLSVRVWIMEIPGVEGLRLCTNAQVRACVSNAHVDPEAEVLPLRELAKGNSARRRTGWRHVLLVLSVAMLTFARTWSLSS